MKSTGKLQIILATGATALATSLAASALAAEEAPRPAPFERIDLTVRDALEQERAAKRYRKAYRAAEQLGVAPKRNLAAADRAADADRVREAARRLERKLKRAEAKAAAAERKAAARVESVGVSQSTLEAIAACESGGDPTAVNAAGYYGKYQFDLGTWASVGGSGNPAEASEAEQDYRAALLYSRAGSSPWPVCGS